MSRDYSNLTALVVDDDPVVRIVVTKELESAGIRSVTVSNGTEAIQRLKDHKFDFILMDISMPEQDGLDATRWIRDMQHSSNSIPIFAVTSYGSEEHTAEILEAGFNEHFTKPFDLNKLLAALDNYFKPNL